MADKEQAESQTLPERPRLIRKMIEDQGINLGNLISATWLALDEVPHSQWMPEQLQALEDFSTLIQLMPRPFKK